MRAFATAARTALDVPFAREDERDDLLADRIEDFARDSAPRPAPFVERERDAAHPLLGEDVVDDAAALARIREIPRGEAEIAEALSVDPEYRRLAIRLGRAPDPYGFCLAHLMDAALAA